MPTNVTYLLGAGASFEAIPLIRKGKFGPLSSEIVDFAASLNSLKSSESFFSVLSRRSITRESATDKMNKISSALDKFGRNCTFFSSPDTYARNLYLQGNKEKELDDLKFSLSTYLALIQHKNVDSIDTRYVPFLASILQKEADIQFPDNVRILSWNYDFQLELSLKHFRPNLRNVNEIQEHFRITPSLNKIEWPSVVHLNGVAGTFKDELGTFSHAFENPNREPYEEYVISKLIEGYDPWFTRSVGTGDLLSFAWEIGAHDRIKQALNIIAETQVLVVIGYSFPFFNRSIDKQLIRRFVDNRFAKDLKRVYIQNPSFSEESKVFFKETHKIPNEIGITALSYTDQFFLPPEL